MANINQLVRRKQNLRMALIGLGISAVPQMRLKR